MEAKTKGRRRCRRRAGWSISALVCFSLFPSILYQCSSPEFYLCVFIPLSLLVFLSFFGYSSMPPPCLCVFLFLTLYPFSFASNPLYFFFLLFSCFFQLPCSPLFSVFFPLLSLFLPLFSVFPFLLHLGQQRRLTHTHTHTHTELCLGNDSLH